MTMIVAPPGLRQYLVARAMGVPVADLQRFKEAAVAEQRRARAIAAELPRAAAATAPAERRGDNMVELDRARLEREWAHATRLTEGI